MLLLLWLRRRIRRRNTRRYWVHPIQQKRDSLGEFHHLYPQLIKDSEKFIKYFRMQKSSFSELQDICQDDLLKENTNYRKAISPIERLTVTLR